jgi:hypothetical protein
MSGADGRARYWHRAVPLVAARGHEPVAVDMPTDESAGLVEHTDAAVAALDKAAGAAPADLVVVAQSTGGFVGPLVCDRVPARLLILVNAMVPAPAETPASRGATPVSRPHAPRTRRGWAAPRTPGST